jgi:2-keto-4-pentenoate hydratase/2-oxohepta-3-ene-1,7-dioic acid hydratase in catechol pathway
MRFCQYDDPLTGELTVGVQAPSGRVLSLELLLELHPMSSQSARIFSMIDVIESCNAGSLSLAALTPWLTGLNSNDEKRLGALDAAALHLRAPVTAPPKFFAIAINGKANWERSIKPPDAKAQYFIKVRTCLTGPYDPVEIPDIGSVGPEVELALIIGRPGKHITVANAPQHIFGYTVHNDLTAHDLRVRSEWIKLRRKDGSEERLTYPGRWKNFDTFSPMGPWLSTADEVPDPHSLDMWAKLNGELVQQGNSGDVAFTAPELIAYLSQAHTLEAGDIISLGTVPAVEPWTMAGIDLRRHGGVIEAGISGIGALRNPIVPV